VLNQTAVRNLVRLALAEDQGSGDATTLAVVPAELEIEAVIRTRETCVCAGLQVAAAVFSELDPKTRVECSVPDGQNCRAGTVLGRVTGRARAILTGERVALNFLQRMSGIATLTRRFVDAVTDWPAEILDTRKTTPGLRLLEKYAVRKGGGTNHRFGLHDRIMIKDNHRALASLEGPGGITRAVNACRKAYPNLQVEVEADTLDEVREAVAAGADYVLLDNMNEEEMREAVELSRGKCLLEASGGITLDTVATVAATGVDFISVGALTHSAPAVDIGLDIVLPA
jgi:nicotinate-nucleotide pyrophosphorylase (carboxylating)